MDLKALYEEFNEELKDLDDWMHEWYEKYKKIIDRVEKRKENLKNGESLDWDKDANFLQQVVFDKKTGIAAVGFGFIAHREKEALRNSGDFLKSLESLIQEPTHETYEKFAQTGWGEIINGVKIGKHPLLVNRTAAACTTKLSVLADNTKFNSIFNKLQELNYIPRAQASDKEDWYTQNEFLVGALREAFKQELADGTTDEFKLNIFIWWLYQRFFKGDEEEEKEDKWALDCSGSKVYAEDVVNYDGIYFCPKCMKILFWRKIKGRTPEFYHWRYNPQCPWSSTSGDGYRNTNPENHGIDYEKRWDDAITALINSGHLDWLEGQEPELIETPLRRYRKAHPGVRVPSEPFIVIESENEAESFIIRFFDNPPIIYERMNKALNTNDNVVAASIIREYDETTLPKSCKTYRCPECGADIDIKKTTQDPQGRWYFFHRTFNLSCSKNRNERGAQNVRQ